MTGSDRITFHDDREAVPEAARDAFDSIADSRGGVRGPFPVLMNNPELAQLIGPVGHYIRYEGELPDPDREIVINATARHFDCPYEWAAHAPIAREAGVDDSLLDAIAEETDPAGLPEPASTLVTYTWSLLGDHEVPDDVFDAALERYGESGLVELTATVGYYALIASVLNAFEVLPEESYFA